LILEWEVAWSYPVLTSSPERNATAAKQSMLGQYQQHHCSTAQIAISCLLLLLLSLLACDGVPAAVELRLLLLCNSAPVCSWNPGKPYSLTAKML
jgi:hypothetical protein